MADNLAKILEDYVQFFKEQSKELERLETYVSKVVSSAAPLETQIKAFIAGFETKKAPIQNRLIELYQKNETAIVDTEQELREILPDFQDRMEKLYEDILNSPYSINPLVLQDFLSTGNRIDFDILKEEIISLAKPKSEAQLRDTILEILGEVIQHRKAKPSSPNSPDSGHPTKSP